jgi:hypothetical protein
VTKRRAAVMAREPSPRYRVAHVGPVLVDSGPLIALFNAADHWHATVLAWLETNPAARCSHSRWRPKSACRPPHRQRLRTRLPALGAARRRALDSAVPGSLTEVLRISERFASLPFTRPTRRSPKPRRACASAMC